MDTYRFSFQQRTFSSNALVFNFWVPLLDIDRWDEEYGGLIHFRIWFRNEIICNYIKWRGLQKIFLCVEFWLIISNQYFWLLAYREKWRERKMILGKHIKAYIICNLKLTVSEFKLEKILFINANIFTRTFFCSIHVGIILVGILNLDTY